MAQTENNVLLFTFLAVFLLLGWALPYIYNEYGGSEYNTNAAVDELASAEVGALDIMTSIATVFFWSFGPIPIWLNIFLLIPRLIFWVIVYDKIRGI